jgi:hypothetical protein
MVPADRPFSIYFSSRKKKERKRERNHEAARDIIV